MQNCITASLQNKGGKKERGRRVCVLFLLLSQNSVYLV